MSNAFASNSVSNWEKIYGDFSNVQQFNRLMQSAVWALRNVTSGASVSNRAGRQLKTSNLDGLPRQWTTITLRKCCDSSKSSTNSPWSCRSRNLKVRATWFWPTNWRCVALPQNLCNVCRQMHKKRPVSVRSCLIVRVLMKTSEKCNRWWNLGVRLRCWNKSAVIAVDGKIVATTTKSTSVSLKCEDDVDSFFTGRVSFIKARCHGDSLMFVVMGIVYDPLVQVVSEDEL